MYVHTRCLCELADYWVWTRDSSVGRAEDCRVYTQAILRSLVQFRFAGYFFLYYFVAFIFQHKFFLSSCKCAANLSNSLHLSPPLLFFLFLKYIWFLFDYSRVWWCFARTHTRALSYRIYRICCFFFCYPCSNCLRFTYTYQSPLLLLSCYNDTTSKKIENKIPLRRHRTDS